VGQDSDSEDSEHGEDKGRNDEGSIGSVRHKEPHPNSESTSDSLAMEQRLSDPTPALPTSATDESTDKPAATLPRNFPRQQVGSSLVSMCVITQVIVVFRVLLPDEG
jgi:hypothetical protein